MNTSSFHLRWYRKTWIDFVCDTSVFLPPSTKLGEGNVFSRVCLSTSVHVTITHDAISHLTIQGPSPSPYKDPLVLPSSHPTPQSPSPRNVQTCLTWTLFYKVLPPNMVRLVQLGTHCPVPQPTPQPPLPPPQPSPHSPNCRKRAIGVRQNYLLVIPNN